MSPFKSEAQRRKLWATNPELAREFEDATPSGRKLPERVRREEPERKPRRRPPRRRRR